MTERLLGLPGDFESILVAYHAQITAAISRNAHHDHRRALLIELLRKTFGIEVDEIELELKVKAAEARGRIDAFYRSVIFEVKIDLDRERADAIRELKNTSSLASRLRTTLRPSRTVLPSRYMTTK